MEHPPTGFEAYLSLGAVLLVLVWLAGVGITEGNLGYLTRVAQHTTLFMPLFAGRYAKQLPRCRRLWIVAMTVNAIIALPLGAREPGLFPWGLYLIGRIVGEQGRARVRAISVMAVASIPVLFLSSAIGLVRADVGRGGFESFSFDRVNAVVDRIFFHFSSSSSSGQQVMDEGLGRFIVWPNISAAVMTPESIPYRGWEGMGQETVNSIQIFRLTGKTKSDVNEEGMFHAVASRYGYLVNDATSVDWGMLADGWSRSGPWGVLVFALLLALLFLIVEHCLARGVMGPSATLLMFGIMVFNAARLPPIRSFLYISRQTVLDFVAIAGIIFVVERLRPRIDLLLSRKRHTLEGGTWSSGNSSAASS